MSTRTYALILAYTARTEWDRAFLCALIGDCDRTGAWAWPVPRAHFVI